jgi:predicted CoA-binding protein
METKKIIEDFFESGNIAVVGATDNKQKFGYTIYSELKSKGFNVFPVNSGKEMINGDKCYKSLGELPQNVDNAVLVIKPEKTAPVIEEAAHANIKRIWMQQGSESDEAVKLCSSKNIPVIQKKCVLMYAPPVKSVHKFHRGIWKIIGKL